MRPEEVKLHPFINGTHSSGFSYLVIPKSMLGFGRALGIDSNIAVLYALLWDRMKLSVKNGWKDEIGYYVCFTRADAASIKVEASGYGTSSWTASAKRTYPNLSDADVSLIPKTTEDSGRTLTLADVDWQETTTDIVDGDAVAVRYTAVATYTGTVTGRYATGYTVTVDYSGEVTKSSSDTIIYTAVFECHPEPEPSPTVAVPEEPEETPPIATEAPQRTAERQEADSISVAAAENAARRIVILSLAGVLIVAALGYGGYMIFKSVKAKKK